MKNCPDFMLMLIKWPILIGCILAIMPAFGLIISVFTQYMDNRVLYYFILPFCGTVVVWFTLFYHSSWSFLSTLEHELTHLFFILLTFHKPTHLSVTLKSGGNVGFEGKGNWLIALSPYFFPLFPIIVMLCGLFYHQIPNYYLAVFALISAYHTVTTLTSIHAGQTDFVSGGKLFSLFFLPSVNLIMYGMMFYYAFLGNRGPIVFFQKLVPATILFTKNLIS